MKAILLIAALFAVSSYASTVHVTCTVGEDTLEVYSTEKDEKSFQVVSLIGPSGLGPEYLIEQYVAVSSQVKIVSEKVLSLQSILPFEGALFIEINAEAGLGKIVFPNSKVDANLSECSFKAE